MILRRMMGNKREGNSLGGDSFSLESVDRERGRNPRIAGPFPASVSGIDAGGERFETEAAIDDLSASDFNLRLGRLVDLGDKLFVVAQVYEATVAMRGIVALRTRKWRLPGNSRNQSISPSAPAQRLTVNY